MKSIADITEPLTRMDKILVSFIKDAKKIQESLHRVIQNLNEVSQDLNNLKGVYTQKECATKEPIEKYRSYTKEEFLMLFDLGKFHSIRKIGNPDERLIITDIYNQGDYIYAKLNSSDTGYGPLWFYKECEYFDGESWKPFGIKE